MFKRASWLAALAIAAAGCAGSDGAQGPQGPQGAAGADGTDYTAVLKPEACAGCHEQTGGLHQAAYDKFTDTTNYGLSFDAVQTVGTTSALTFSISINGTPYTGDEKLVWMDQKTFYAVLYNPATRQFTPSFQFSNPSATGIDGQYVATSTAATFAPESAGSVTLIAGYIADNLLPSGSAYTLYDDVVNVGRVYGGTLDYVSAANVTACENCHGAPYQKHGYRAAHAKTDPASTSPVPDFAACKTCHYDTRKGGHEAWQLLADDPLAYANQAGTPTATQKTWYGYTANVMNDVHMSHAMEFAYPQSMQSCKTCHDGKLNVIFADAQFKLSTCRSCHPMYGPQARNQPQYVEDTRAPALQPLMVSTVSSPGQYHASFAGTPADPKLYTTSANQLCNGCHATGNGMGAPTFAQLHNGGYERKIYTAANNGTRYSDVFTATVDAVSMSTLVAKVDFSVTDADGTDPLNVGSVTPTVIIGLYGYDTKDFIIASHSNDSTGKRALEWVYGASHPRFKALKVLPRADGKFQFTVDLTDYKAMIDAKTVKRIEIAVLPTLKLADGTTVALKAPSRTFDLARKAFDANFFQPIVDANKCNKCHDALGVSFHSGDRGGNVTVCRLCHETRTPGGHLETQARSIDSYVHAIHKMQPFDVGDIDFADPVEKLRYEHHVESTYPNFTLLNCESCHNPGTYEVPSQSRSLPGVGSATDVTTGWTRTIAATPKYVQGPAARACGACHRVEALNEDNAGAFEATNEHFRANGYLIEDTGGVVDQVIGTIMSIFK